MENEEMKDEEFAICPDCHSVIDSTVKETALNLAEAGQGYGSVIYARCYACNSLLLAHLKWTPVIVSVELANKKMPGDVEK